jgi:hypothetical protein
MGRLGNWGLPVRFARIQHVVQVEHTHGSAFAQGRSKPAGIATLLIQMNARPAPLWLCNGP